MVRLEVFVIFLACAPLARARDLSGDYVCSYGCRLTDANPSVAIDGETADCTNELGGIFHGRRLTETSIACFNKTGVLAEDGVTLRWSDGVVWKRHLGPAQ
jgi:hypothetical protein